MACRLGAALAGLMEGGPGIWSLMRVCVCLEPFTPRSSAQTAAGGLGPLWLLCQESEVVASMFPYYFALSPRGLPFQVDLLGLGSL